ncbi:MAG: dihydrolipoamide dehydrogenase [Chloroflexi bacterium]|jgi:dihydrolipoamide dehydrogenase|nr:MAG: dihydrolipoamide dehydrogenase [Chloroflexota bacterium]|tara:strand:+ start:1314 stop:2741 length:1428 start_codon:yes stop_codon:yes gene_type:complete
MSIFMSLKVVVIGAGPGGYPAAFRAADLGMDVTLIDPASKPGGVCLYVGCIPSKALLHAAHTISEAKHANEYGVEFNDPKIDLDKLRIWKDGVIGKMTGGLGMLMKQRKVKFLQGSASFTSSKQVNVTLHEGGQEVIDFDFAIIATGSVPVSPPIVDGKTNLVMDSTSALEIPDVPKNLLVVGGGYIGLELGTVYANLGSKVTVVEMTSGLLPGADRDLVEILKKDLDSKFEDILLTTKVEKIIEKSNKLRVTLSDLEKINSNMTFDKALIAVGRTPMSKKIGLENTFVKINERGFIETDLQCRTSDPVIFAIGDVAGEPMLAHKATKEAHVAIDVINGKPAMFDPLAIPAVVFTEPELAWTGLSELEARQKNWEIEISKFPWAASGRATTMGIKRGMTKIISEPSTKRIIGVGIVGNGAGEMIAEATLAIEMGTTLEDMKSIIHAHPTLSETLMETAEIYYNQSPHYFSPKKNK